MQEPDEIADWFRLAELGAGGFGTVTVWQHKKTADCVAVKKCKSTCLNEVQKKRWIKEVETLKILKHDNVIGFKKLPQDLQEELYRYNPSGLPLLSMEYCCGGNLRRMLSRPENLNGLPEVTIRNILHDISNALNYMHDRNIAHRDIKPENVVMQLLPQRTLYKLIDLGYAKEMDSTVSFVGTFRYLAPEIFFLKDYNVTVDYWSFGVLTYEIMTGAFPFSPVNNMYEMFKNIEKKSPGDICISNDSGIIQNSSEIKHDTRVTSCFKELIQKWLRSALQFDPKLRGKSIERSDANIFARLKEILSKTIVVVFSFLTLEFYSYEIDDWTLIKTLRDWIARDLRVADSKEILLLNAQGDNKADEDFVKNCTKTSQETVNFWAFKKNETVRIPQQFSLPHSVIKVMSTPITNSADRECLCRHSIFFIEKERILMDAVNKGDRLYMQHLKNSFRKLTESVNVIITSVLKLSTQIETYSALSSKHCAIYEKFLREVKKDVDNTKGLLQRYKKQHAKMPALQKSYKDALVLFEENDIKYLYNTLLKLAEKIPDKNRNKEILNLISSTIKMKVNVFDKDNGGNHQRYLIKAKTFLGEIDKLLKWADDLQHNFDVDLKKIAFLYRVTFNDCNNNYFTKDADAENVIKENMYLRARFEGFLMSHIDNFKSYRNL